MSCISLGPSAKVVGQSLEGMRQTLCRSAGGVVRRASTEKRRAGQKAPRTGDGQQAGKRQAGKARQGTG